MFTLRDFEIKQEIYRDEIKWAEHERLVREIVRSTKGQEEPLYSQLRSLIARWLFNSGKFLQRRQRSADPVF